MKRDGRHGLERFVSGQVQVAGCCECGNEPPDSNLITIQKDETYSVYYISVGSSTCFGC